MLSEAKKPFMLRVIILSIIKLNVVIQNVVASLGHLAAQIEMFPFVSKEI